MSMKVREGQRSQRQVSGGQRGQQGPAGSAKASGVSGGQWRPALCQRGQRGPAKVNGGQRGQRGSAETSESQHEPAKVSARSARASEVSEHQRRSALELTEEKLRSSS